MPAPMRPLPERLFPRLDAEGDCWLWTGGKTSLGYGMVGRGARSEGVALVHRVVYEHLVGDLPKDSVLIHECRARNCCNPDHMQLAPRAQLLRMNEKRGKK